MTTAGSRRGARERAFSLLYEAEAKSESPATIVDDLPIEPDPYAARLVLGVQQHATEIDALLSRYAKGWKLERMPAVDRAVLRVAVYELLAERGVPTAAVVSEAVELASQYSTDESGRFVNGLLARIAIETRGGAAPAPHVPPPLEPTEVIDFGVDPDFELPPAPSALPNDGVSDPADLEDSDTPDHATDSDDSDDLDDLDDSDDSDDLDDSDAPDDSVDRAVMAERPSEQKSPAPVSARPRLPVPLPQPPLGDGIIRLRPWQPVDAPALVAAWTDPAVVRWSAPPARRSVVDARRWIAGTPGLREDGLALDLVISSIGSRPVVLGEVGLSGFDDDGGADIGYWVAPEHRGKGYATRAVRLVTAWALNQHGLRAVHATVEPANRPSIAVLRRAGFRAERPTRWVST